MAWTDMFGGVTAANPYADYLTPEQQTALRNQAMMDAGLSMLMNSQGTPGQPMPSFAKVLGGGLLGANQGFRQGSKDLYDMAINKRNYDMQKQLFDIKMMEAKRQADAMKVLRDSFGLNTSSSPSATYNPPVDPNSFKFGMQGTGPKVIPREEIQLNEDGTETVIGGPVAQPAAAPTTTDVLANLDPRTKALIAAMKPDKALETLTSLMTKERGAPLSRDQIIALGLDPNKEYTRDQYGGVQSLGARVETKRTLSAEEASKQTGIPDLPKNATYTYSPRSGLNIAFENQDLGEPQVVEVNGKKVYAVFDRKNGRWLDIKNEFSPVEEYGDAVKGVDRRGNLIFGRLRKSDNQFVGPNNEVIKDFKPFREPGNYVEGVDLNGQRVFAMIDADGAPRDPNTGAMIYGFRPSPEISSPFTTAGADGNQLSVLKNGKVETIGAAPLNVNQAIESFVQLRGRQPSLDNPQDVADLKALGTLGSSSTNVNVVNEAAGKGAEEYFKQMGKDLPGLEAQAITAQRTNQALQDMLELNKNKTFTGTMAQGQIGAAQFLNGLGVPVAEETLANTREFQAASNILVLDFMGAMGGARGFSKEESEILYDAFPKIIDNPKARVRIANMLIRRNNRIIEEYKRVRENFGKKIGVENLTDVLVEPTDVNQFTDFRIKRVRDKE